MAFSVCLFAFGGLMAIWWHIGRKQKDSGQVWLALSILCWSFSGLAEVVYSQSSSNHLTAVQLDGGDLKNDGLVTGLPSFNDIEVLSVAGNVENSGQWLAILENVYCIGGENNLPADRFEGASKSCSATAAALEDCACGN